MPLPFPRLLISIHALREEGDGARPFAPSSAANFYPRPPRGGRPRDLALRVMRLIISIHALREEGDHQLPVSGTRHWTISIHALREEGDSKNRDKISIFKQIIQHSARI